MREGLRCNKCGGSFERQPSTFPGFDLLACKRCSRPIRLLRQVDGKGWSRSQRRAKERKAERAARRSGLI